MLRWALDTPKISLLHPRRSSKLRSSLGVCMHGKPACFSVRACCLRRGPIPCACISTQHYSTTDMPDAILHFRFRPQLCRLRTSADVVRLRFTWKLARQHECILSCCRVSFLKLLRICAHDVIRTHWLAWTGARGLEDVLATAGAKIGQANAEQTWAISSCNPAKCQTSPFPCLAWWRAIHIRP